MSAPSQTCEFPHHAQEQRPQGLRAPLRAVCMLVLRDSCAAVSAELLLLVVTIASFWPAEWH